MISNHFKLPANLKGWAEEAAKLPTSAERIYPEMGPLAWSYSMTIRDPNVLSGVRADFNEWQAPDRRVITADGLG
jgi:hypothetical protein